MVKLGAELTHYLKKTARVALRYNKFTIYESKSMKGGKWGGGRHTSRNKWRVFLVLPKHPRATYIINTENKKQDNINILEEKTSFFCFLRESALPPILFG
eukprot:GEMP01108839.1.p1 GENE.GEMP01108839.1~~GEMP01108839.1.p1  ORF type:complete len:100 (-),score=2.33 GEMP01108839.1:337-636(-)